MGPLSSCTFGCTDTQISNKLIQMLQQALKVNQIRMEYDIEVGEDVVDFIRQATNKVEMSYIVVKGNKKNRRKEDRDNKDIQNNDKDIQKNKDRQDDVSQYYTIIDQIQHRSKQQSQQIKKTYQHRLLIIKGKHTSNQSKQSDILKLYQLSTQCLIIYQTSFYHGHLSSLQANNQGKLYLYSLTPDIIDTKLIYHYQLTLIASGRFIKDDFISGILIHQKIDYEWQTFDKQTKITFIPHQIKNINKSSIDIKMSAIRDSQIDIGKNIEYDIINVKSYRGVLNLGCYDSIMKLFNGVFQIEYQNGDKYLGEVADGKKHTSNSMGKYIKKGGQEYYQGGYKDDRRQGYGRCYIKHHKHNNLIFIIEGEWKDGQIKQFKLRCRNRYDNPEEMSQICSMERVGEGYKVKELINYDMLCQDDIRKSKDNIRRSNGEDIRASVRRQ